MDYTLRPSIATDHCFGVGNLTSQSILSLQPCKTAKTQQFLVEIDGTIRPRYNTTLCLTHGSSKFHLSQCYAEDSQVFDMSAESSGKLKLLAQPNFCMNLLNGDSQVGELDLYKCHRDMNQVFIYSGGNAIVSGMAFQLDLMHRAGKSLWAGPAFASFFLGPLSILCIALFCYLLLRASNDEHMGQPTSEKGNGASNHAMFLVA